VAGCPYMFLPVYDYRRPTIDHRPSIFKAYFRPYSSSPVTKSCLGLLYSMKKYLILLTSLLASASYTQVPQIDSMLVDEMKSELHIFGSFGSVQGKVTVDSVDAPIKSWLDTILVASILDTGKGSAGPVVVRVGKQQSAPRMITLWKGTSSLSHWEIHSFSLTSGYSFHFLLRMDLYPLITQKNQSIRFFVPNKKTSLMESYSQRETYNPEYGYETDFEMGQTLPEDTSLTSIEGFVCQGFLDLSSKTLTFNITNIKGFEEQVSYIGSKGQPSLATSPYYVRDFTLDVPLDSLFRIQSYYLDTSYFNGVYGDVFNRFGTYYFPPLLPKFVIINKPKLLFPLSATFFSYRNNINLRWDSLLLLTNYHMEVSTDSSFSIKFIDTIISSPYYALEPLTGLTKYYWRVSVINSEGESPWSDVWYFWTGATSDDVKGKDNFSTFSCFPNPSSKQLTILYSIPADGNARIILYDLTGRIIRESTVNTVGENRLNWDVSQIPSGSYVVGLATGKESRSQLVSIVH
jgi:hypothetical protein